MPVNLPDIVVQIQISYHFKMQISRFLFFFYFVLRLMSQSTIFQSCLDEAKGRVVVDSCPRGPGFNPQPGRLLLWP